MEKVLSWPEWVTVEEAAARVGVTPEAIIKLIKSGELRAFYFAAESETIH